MALSCRFISDQLTLSFAEFIKAMVDEEIIPIPLNYCPLVLVKIPQEFVALNSNSQLFLNRAPTLIYFSFAQQDHKLN